MKKTLCLLLVALFSVFAVGCVDGNITSLTTTTTEVSATTTTDATTTTVTEFPPTEEGGGTTVTVIETATSAVEELTTVPTTTTTVTTTTTTTVVTTTTSSEPVTTTDEVVTTVTTTVQPTTTVTTKRLTTTSATKPSKTTKSVPTAWTTTIPKGPYIPKEEAIRIALEHAKFNRADVRDLEAEFEISHGTPVYEVGFEVGRMEYDYAIHAETGAVHAYHVEDPVNSTGVGSVSMSAPKPDGITKTVAREIALKHAEVTADTVRDFELELDVDDGVYEISFESGNWEYNYEIDAKIGAVVKHEKEPID